MRIRNRPAAVSPHTHLEFRVESLELSVFFANNPLIGGNPIGKEAKQDKSEDLPIVPFSNRFRGMKRERIGYRVGNHYELRVDS